MKKVLFLCVENSARSQMAEGLLRHMSGHNFEVFSAGSAPAKRVNPMAIAVMAEIGIDISKQTPKGLEGFDLDSMNFIITLCAEESCPTTTSGRAKKLNWNLPNPTDPSTGNESPIRRFRKIRDKLRDLIHDLAPPGSW